MSKPKQGYTDTLVGAFIEELKDYIQKYNDPNKVMNPKQVATLLFFNRQKSKLYAALAPLSKEEIISNLNVLYAIPEVGERLVYLLILEEDEYGRRFTQLVNRIIKNPEDLETLFLNSKLPLTLIKAIAELMRFDAEVWSNELEALTKHSNAALAEYAKAVLNVDASAELKSVAQPSM